jgi:ferredoxin-thioredoxin reductase catalytic subunit
MSSAHILPDPEELAKTAEKIRNDAEKLAGIKGWIINPDSEMADTVFLGLARNKLVRGRRYCPCRLPSGDQETDRKYICPCREAETDIERDGHCHCYLYLKER